MDLAVVSFIIAVIGICLQIFDAFPNYRETRHIVVLLAIGMFIGIAASALLGAKYEIQGSIDQRFLLLYGLVLFSVVFAASAVALKDSNRREVAVNLTIGFAALFVLSGFGIGLSSIERMPDYSTEEILLLANRAETEGQFDVAIERLKELKARTQNQKARDAIKVRLDKIEATQVGLSAVELQPSQKK